MTPVVAVMATVAMTRQVVAATTQATAAGEINPVCGYTSDGQIAVVAPDGVG